MLSWPKVVLGKKRDYINTSLGKREFHDLFPPKLVGHHPLSHEADLQEMLWAVLML